MIFTLVDMTFRCSDLDGTSIGGHPLAYLSVQALATAITRVARVLAVIYLILTLIDRGGSSTANLFEPTRSSPSQS